MTETHFEQMQVERPVYEQVAARYREIEDTLNSGDPTQAIQSWDALRRELSDYASLTRLKFSQDTKDQEAKEAREYVDELYPRLEEFETQFKRELLERADELHDALGEHVFELWRADVATFEPTIEDDLVAESKTSAEYTELVASAEIEFEGETYNLSQIRKFTLDSDRERRHRAQKARWDWFGEHGDEFDEIYDRLVKLRTSMAHKLDFEHYVPLGYLRRQRIDYGAEDVARFRQEVTEQIVPLACDIVAKQATDLGVDEVMVWDEPVFDAAGSPRLMAQGDELIERAHQMFDEMHPELGSFFSMMDRRGLMDLPSRNAKASGGFCTSFATYGVPYIFANFNGTKGDVEVFTHEMGHAFQCWLSMDKYPIDVIWPTLESCEIHSMSLEFLCWPHMELFFGDDAERFRTVHLAESLTFIPYGVAVDHFQHLVYERPDATAAQRRQMWKAMEKTYLPWRQWGDIEHGASGGRWHGQGHIFGGPFYYIDYVLAMTCALQFWNRMNQDPEEAMEDYVALCRRGGEAAFQELARSAKIRSPFERGCLTEAVESAREYLNL